MPRQATYQEKLCERVAKIMQERTGTEVRVENPIVIKGSPEYLIYRVMMTCRGTDKAIEIEMPTTRIGYPTSVDGRITKYGKAYINGQWPEEWPLDNGR